jgi:hypothetical protein
MASTLVTRNQFNITPQGIVHKSTEAAFIPHPSDPDSGTDCAIAGAPRRVAQDMGLDTSSRNPS